MTDMNSASAARQNISREMSNTLFRNSQANYLVDEILADGKVNTDGKQGQNDEIALGKLRTLLENGQRNGTLNSAESAMLSALDARGWTGTDKDVVLRNLQRIQQLQKQVADNGLDPNTVSFDLETQSFTQRMMGGHDTMTIGVDQTNTNTQASAQPGAPVAAGAESAEGAAGAAQAAPPDNTCSVPTTGPALSTDCQNNTDEEMARQAMIRPTRTAQSDAVRQLQHEAGNLGARIKDPAQVPADKLKGDLLRLHEAVGQDNKHVRQVLDSIGLTESELASQNIIDPQSSAGDNEARLRDYLQGPQFQARLESPEHGPAAIESYRNLIGTAVDAYVQQPSGANFSQLRSLVYDHSYVFENPTGVGQEAVDQYKQLKQTILSVGQQTHLLEQVSKPENLPVSMQQLTGNLNQSTRDANQDTLAAATRLSGMLSQIESQPELFPEANTAALREQLGALAEFDAQGKATSLKQTPPTQATLSTLNAVWAEVEELGLKAGLGDDFSSKGALAQAIQRASAQPGAASDPALQLLQKTPELGEHADLLAQLSKPENRAMLEAVLNNRGEDVSKYFGENNSRFFDLSAMLRGIRSNPTLGATTGAVAGGLLLGGPTGTLLGGAVGLGVSWGLNRLSQAQNQTPADASGITVNLGNFASRLGFGDAAQNTSMDLPNTLRYSTAVQLPNGKNMELTGISQPQVESLMRLLDQNPETRTLLQAQGGNLASILEQSPVAGEVRTALAAKRDFDTAFWSEGSQLEEAQASVQSSLAARSNAQISLEQAALAVNTASQAPNLDPDARALLEAQKTQIAAAQQALQDGGEMPAASPDLDRTLKAVRSSHIESGVTAAESVGLEVQRHLNTERSEPLLRDLEAAVSDGRLQKLLDTLPPEQAASMRELLTSAGSSTPDAREFSSNIREVLNAPSISPQYASHLTTHLQAIGGLLSKANEPGMTREQLSAHGNQILNPNSPLPSSSFDVIDDMRQMQTYIRDMKATLGEDGYQEAAQRFASESRQIFRDLAQPGAGPIDRNQLRQRMDQVMNNIKNEAFNSSLLAGLSSASAMPATGDATAAGPPAPSADSLNQAMTANPAIQTALQSIMGQVGANLSANPEIRPLLEQLNRQDQGALAEIQNLMKGMNNPAELGQQIQSIIGQRMSPADSAKLQQALVSELSNQIGNAVSQAEQSTGNYARTGTQRMQGEVLNALKAYQQLLGSSQEVSAAESQLRSSPLQLAKNMSHSAAELLLKPGMLPPGVTSTQVFTSIFPSLMGNNGRASEAEVLNDLGSFLSKDQATLSRELGVELSTEQFLAMRLSASSLASARAIQDPQLGPVAASLSGVMQHVLEYPDALSDPAQREQLEQILSRAANVTDGRSRDTFLNGVSSFSTKAANQGTTLAGELDATEALLNQPPVQTSPLQNPPSGGTSSSSEQTLLVPAVKVTTSADPVVPNPAPGPINPSSENSASALASAEIMEESIATFAQTLGVTPPGQPAGQPDASADGTGAEISTGNLRPPGGTPAFRITASPPAETQKALHRAFDASINAQRDFYNTYAEMSPEQRNSFKERSGIQEQLSAIETGINTLVNTYKENRSYYQRTLDRQQRAYQTYTQMMAVVSNLMNADPNAMTEALDELSEKLKPEYLKAGVANMTTQITRVADSLVPQPNQSVSQEQQLKELQDFIAQIGEVSPEGRQLMLAQLAEKMITNAIHAFYNQRNRENNMHHLERLEQLSTDFRNQLSDQLTQSMARQAGSSQSAIAGAGQLGGAELSEVLNQTLRTQLDGMLEVSQQMRPPLMTDFKRQQILSTLFDRERGNDLQGLLAIAGTRPN